ncbi:MAG TPA: hypothetical protein VN661_04130 [Candidatus Acidoferrales bacterium]|nr:hypothetical protein [Candidatus Acidoferrales bacterium]
MKWIVRMLCLALAGVVIVPGAFAQDTDHAEIGVFANLFRLQATKTNVVGVGGRLSVNVNPYVQLEGEMAYGFDQAFNSNFATTGGAVSVQRSHFRVIDGLFGPKLQTNRGPVRLFVTAKGGFIHFGFGSGAVTPGSFTGEVGGLESDNMNAVFYPGGGAEAFWGPIGLRLDVGDEIYFNNGAHNNLRVAIGPTIRF